MQDVPGYDVQALLATGGTARVWRALERATGEVVALKQLLPGADPDALAREAEALSRVASPYVVRLRAVLLEGTVLVLDHAPGGTLARVLARREALTPGEVVTVAVPLALGLAAVHAAGLVHGDVSPAHVLLTADGMPMLGDLGAAGTREDRHPVDAAPGCLDPAVLAGGPVTAASDVWALGALAVGMLTGGAAGVSAADGPPALLAVLAGALDPDPAARPSAEELALDLQRTWPAAPLRATDARLGEVPSPGTSWAPVPDRPLTGPRPDRPVPSARPSPLPPPSRRPARRGLVAAAVLALLVAAAGAGWAWGRSGGAPAVTAPPLASAGAAELSWPAVLDALDQARADAFAAGDAALLADVWAPGSAGLAADSAALAGLRGGTVTGLRHRVVDVSVRSPGTDQVALRVVDVLASHQVRAADGSVVRVVAERRQSSYDVVLVRERGRWLLASVAAA